MLVYQRVYHRGIYYFIMVYFINFLIEEIIMVYHRFYHRRVSGR